MKVKHTYTTLHVCMCMLLELLCFTSRSIPRCDKVQWPIRMFCTTFAFAVGRQTFHHLPTVPLHSISPLFFFISIRSCSGDGIAVSEKKPLPQRVCTRAGGWACETYSVQTTGWIRSVSIHSYCVRLFYAAPATMTMSHRSKLPLQGMF